MKINLTSETSFDRVPMTVKNLLEALSPFPEEAFIEIETWDSQREGSGWRIKAHWSEER